MNEIASILLAVYAAVGAIDGIYFSSLEIPPLRP